MLCIKTKLKKFNNNYQEKIAQKLNFKYGIRCMCTNEPHTKIKQTKNNIEDIKQYAKDRIKWQQSIQTKAEIIE